ncbi:MAG TPA: GNAT family N-acetyltransferase [Bacillota bacterium]|nr:GNAT family N-acetyltransferase [Bacillota bacterium]
MWYNLQLIQLLEELAANSWPAQIQQTLGSWRLRANQGVTKRANSVYTSGPIPGYRGWIEMVEDFYTRQGIPPCFCVTEASPPELDEILESREYRKIFECFVMIATCKEVMKCVGHDERFTCEFNDHADSQWIQDFMRLEGFRADSYEGYRQIFSAIGPQKVFVRLRQNGELIGLGTAVVERGWAGLSNIIVSSEHRGKGAATALLRLLTEWAYENDARQMYLQVLKENQPAISLYEKLGFVPFAQYHYRILET